VPNSVIIAAIVVLNIALLALAFAGVRMLRPEPSATTAPEAIIDLRGADSDHRPVAVLHHPAADDLDSLFSYDSARPSDAGTSTTILRDN